MNHEIALGRNGLASNYKRETTVKNNKISSFFVGLFHRISSSVKKPSAELVVDYPYYERGGREYLKERYNYRNLG